MSFGLVKKAALFAAFFYTLCVTNVLGERALVVINEGDCVNCYGVGKWITELSKIHDTYFVFNPTLAKQSAVFIERVIGVNNWPPNNIIVLDKDKHDKLLKFGGSKIYIEKGTTEPEYICELKELPLNIAKIKNTVESVKTSFFSTDSIEGKLTSETVVNNGALSTRCELLTKSNGNRIIVDKMYGAVYWKINNNYTSINVENIKIDNILNSILIDKQLQAIKQYQEQLKSVNKARPNIAKAYVWNDNLWLVLSVYVPSINKKVLSISNKDILVNLNDRGEVVDYLTVDDEVKEYEVDLMNTYYFDGHKWYVSVDKDKVSGLHNYVLGEYIIKDHKLIFTGFSPVEVTEFYKNTGFLGYSSTAPYIDGNYGVFSYDNKLFDINTGLSKTLPLGENIIKTENEKLSISFFIQNFIKTDKGIILIVSNCRDKKWTNYYLEIDNNMIVKKKAVVKLGQYRLATPFVYNHSSNNLEATDTTGKLVRLTAE